MAESALNTGAAPAIRSSTARSVVLCRIRVLLCFVRESSRSGTGVTTRLDVDCSLECGALAPLCRPRLAAAGRQQAASLKAAASRRTPKLLPGEGPDPHVHVIWIDLQL